MPFCAQCGNAVSDQANACPQCGHPTPGAAPAPHAPLWRRLAARMIDGLIITLVTVPLNHFEVGSAKLLVYTSPYSTVIAFAYYWLMIGLMNGQTLGKMIVGIRIARPDGGAVDLGRAALREGVAFVSGAAFGLGYLWAIWDREHRTWHDIVADTRARRTLR